VRVLRRVGRKLGFWVDVRGGGSRFLAARVPGTVMGNVKDQVVGSDFEWFLMFEG